MISNSISRHRRLAGRLALGLVIAMGSISPVASASASTAPAAKPLTPTIVETSWL